MNTLQFTNYPG